MTKSKKNKKVNWKRLSGTTNFYPTYVEGNLDKVTPTSATFKTDFQKVIPRYDLSMTQTRDKGTGPTFLETSYQKPKNSNSERTKKTLKTKMSSKKSSEKSIKKKIRTDFWQ